MLKVNGGANSGHTAGGIKLNLLPAGVVVQDAKHLCIGSGVVADPRKIWWETKPLEKKGYAILSRLVIDERTMVTDLTHRLLPRLRLNYTASIALREGRAAAGGMNVGKFRTRLGFAGDEQESHLTDAGGSIWEGLVIVPPSMVVS